VLHPRSALPAVHSTPHSAAAVTTDAVCRQCSLHSSNAGTRPLIYTLLTSRLTCTDSNYTTPIYNQPWSSRANTSFIYAQIEHLWATAVCGSCWSLLFPSSTQLCCTTNYPALSHHFSLGSVYFENQQVPLPAETACFCPRLPSSCPCYIVNSRHLPRPRVGEHQP
jgi:hypothetical protein